jgi:hypothetical protein
LNGFFENCALDGTLSIADGMDTLIKDCTSADTTLVPTTIDVGGALGTAKISITGHSGGINITNVNQPTDVAVVIMDAGKVIIDSSCTDGQIVVGGVSILIDNSNGATVVDNTINPDHIEDIHVANWNRRVHSNNTITLYEDDGITPRKVFDTNIDLSEITPQ